MNLREILPPSVVAAIRLARTRLIMAGVLDGEERRGRDAAVQALRAQVPAAGSGRRALIFSLRGGWYPHTAWEALIGHAMHLRGCAVHVFNCGGQMPICEVNFRHAAPAIACAECRQYPDRLVRDIGLERSWLADYLTADDRREIRAAVSALSPEQYPSWSFDGRPIGALVRNSVLWFLRKSRVDPGSADAHVYRDFLVAGADIARMAPRLLAAARPDVVIQLNGLFFAEQILNSFVPETCRVATYEAGWRTNSLGFDWLSERGFADMDAPWSVWKDRPLTGPENATLDAWLQGRRGGEMQRDFYVKFDTSRTGPLEALGLRPDIPTAVLFTNLVWDTAVFGRDIAFRSITEWLERTVAWFTSHPDRQLVIRIHPAEDLRPSQESNEKLAAVVRQLTLPPNVRLVPSAAPTNSYALIEAASVVMVYTSTAGLEAALYGRRVLVAARVYYAARGFTSEIDTAAGFDAAMENAFAAGPLSPDAHDLARRFAYLLLFRFLHDVPVVEQRPRTLPLLDAGAAPSIAPGGDADFDALVSALLDGTPLVSQ